MSSAGRWQAIAPASDEPAKQLSAPATQKRRRAVAVACVQCRIKKEKVGLTILPSTYPSMVNTKTFTV